MLTYAVLQYFRNGGFYRQSGNFFFLGTGCSLALFQFGKIDATELVLVHWHMIQNNVDYSVRTSVARSLALSLEEETVFPYSESRRDKRDILF